MDFEEDATALSGASRSVPVLFSLAIFLTLFSFLLGWFSVDTRIQVWEYDPNHPEGKGEATIGGGRVDTELKFFAFETRITPRDVHEQIENSVGLPNYEENAAAAGSTMRGLLFLWGVALLALFCVAGFYAWHRKSTRDFSSAIWKCAGVYGAMSVLALGYLGFELPEKVEDDIQGLLNDIANHRSFQSYIPQIDPTVLAPDVKFWNTWTCCPPTSVVQGPDGQDYLVVVTTESRPSAAFWMDVTGLATAAAALVLAVSSRSLRSKDPSAVPKAQVSTESNSGT